MLDKSFVKISFVKITLSFENALCLKSLDNTDYLEVCLYFNRTFHLLPRLGKLLYIFFQILVKISFSAGNCLCTR